MSETNVTPIPINWEAVRALAMVVGVREAARRMELSEDRVRQRSHREGWLASESAKRAVQIANANRVAEKSVTTLSPAALIHAEIATLGSKTRLSLARGIAKAGEHIETMDGQEILIDAQNIKSVAQTADLVHGWKDAAPQVKIRLDVLSGSAQPEPIDITPDVSTSWEEDSVDPLDEY
jgi:hypothetical protein